ncbi:MAG: hypothetical protein LBS09_08385 [Bacteroidales bacterium]|jgi:hypothetical protein|nr:hypothetical protein [Bacteroidales bacterium]
MMYFKRILMCSMMLSVMATACLLACIWFVDRDDDYTGYFRNDILERKNYYFSFLNIYDTSAEMQSDRAQNVKEWKRHLGGNISNADAEQLIYRVDLRDVQAAEAKARHGQWQSIDANLRKNSMLRRIVQQRDLGSLNYLLYAKACEQQAGRRSEAWEEVSYDVGKQDSLMHRGVLLYRASKQSFLRLRYAFQVVRMAFYAGRKDDCLRYYREMIEPFANRNDMAILWAMSFYASVAESDAQSLYAYARVFDECPRYSDAAMVSFRWKIKTADTVGLGALCRDDAEKSILQAMIGFTRFEPTMEPLTLVYRLHPASPYLETLLVREINKIEYGWEGEEREFYRDYAARLEKMAERCAALGEVQHPALWYTAAAYLSCLLGEHEQSSLLADIAEQAHPDAKTAEQLMVVRLLTETDLEPFDAASETRILPALRWILERLQEEREDDTPHGDDNSTDHSFLSRVAAHYFAEKLPDLYLKCGQPVKAALCISIALQHSEFAQYAVPNPDALTFLDRHTEIAQLDEALRQLSATDKTNEYDAFLYRAAALTANTILELKGTKHLRALRFHEAVECFENLSDASNVFHLNDDPFDLAEAFGRKKAPNEHLSFHSKLTFAREMADLQSLIKENKASPENLFRYACGMFQMSFYGNSWQLLSYRWTIHDKNMWETVQPHDEMYYYYQVGTAHDCFMQAFNRSRNNEFKAQCLFYASYCRQMTAPVYVWQQQTGRMPGNYLTNNPHFSRLKNRYGKTNFYRDAVTRCSYLSDFG